MNKRIAFWIGTFLVALILLRVLPHGTGWTLYLHGRTRYIPANVAWFWVVLLLAGLIVVGGVVRKWVGHVTFYSARVVKKDNSKK
jgi:hypothetical protein